MKRLVAVFVVSVLAGVILFAQASKIISSGTLPSECTNGAIYWKTGSSKGLYGCDAGTWQGPYITSASGGGTVTNTGTLTAGKLIIGNGSADITVSSTTGIAKLASGALTAATAGTDYLNPATGMTLIEQQTPTGTAVTFSSLGTFTHLQIVYSARSDTVATSANINLTFNGDTGNNYDTQNDIANGATASASEGLAQANSVVATISAASAPSGAAGVGEFVIADYRGTTFRKGGTASVRYKLADTSGNFVLRVKGFEWRDTSAITSIALTLSAGNFVSGSKFTLYGLP